MLFKEIVALDNGAQFLNVDLHIHSYGSSHDVKDTTMTPQAIVDSAVAQGLSIIAITDHNSDKNVAAAIAHAQQYAGRLLVLPGVEVTTSHGHLLVYFAPESVEVLTKFIHKLDLVGPQGADNTHTAKSMTDVIAEAERLGGICIAAHIDREKTGFEMFAPGFQNWKRDIVASSGLYGIECDDKDHLVWYSDADEPGSAGVERRKIFQLRKANPALKGRHQLAYVQGSDSHSMANFQNPKPQKPWTKIKLTELSFSAFRTALVDPSARVRARSVLPPFVPRIRGMAITGGFLHQEAIHFSDNLNCFIGGRGTGKSTAIRGLAYAFGLNEEFGEYDNCADSIIVWCEGADGVIYRYERSKGGDISVKANEDAGINDVPTDSFRIEYFGQGELAEVAKDPLKTPQLFQKFLDRHTSLRDLNETEASLVAQLRENASRLVPLENNFLQLADKRKFLAEVEQKLKLAEEGKLKEVVAVQSKIVSEKTVRGAVEQISQAYAGGLNLSVLEKCLDQILTTAGTVTADPQSVTLLQSVRNVIDATNAELKAKTDEINAFLRLRSKELTALCAQLKTNHIRMDTEMAAKVADLKARGLAGNVTELEQLIRQKGNTGREITSVEQRSTELAGYKDQRAKLLKSLAEVRQQMTTRRKDQLRSINQNLSLTIPDYLIFVRYEDSGITDAFSAYLKLKMHGSYLQDQTIEQICMRVTPADLSTWILARDLVAISTGAGISQQWAQEMVGKLCYWEILLELQVLAKPPKPVITVRTRTTPPKEIPVFQLSDGQRHTILLTIAMLAETNVPLVIDQPEDDLDNAFIFATVVATLRAIKERRQVILVTHNANIAVLGDSELILPMHRENNCGKAKDRGSIDGLPTKMCVQNILEGGPDAFCKRREIYGH